MALGTTWFSPSDLLWNGSLVCRQAYKKHKLKFFGFSKSSFPLGLMLSRVTWFSCKTWVSYLWGGNENTFAPKTIEGSRWHIQQTWSQGTECKLALASYGFLSINLLIPHRCKLYLLCPGWVFSHSKCSSVFLPSRSPAFPQLHHGSLRRPTLHSYTPFYPQCHLFGCTSLLQAVFKQCFPQDVFPNPALVNIFSLCVFLLQFPVNCYKDQSSKPDTQLCMCVLVFCTLCFFRIDGMSFFL